jgi:hypothetical protein
MNRDQDAAFQQSSFVPFGFIFWNSHSNQNPGESTESPAYANSRKSRN